MLIALNIVGNQSRLYYDARSINHQDSYIKFVRVSYINLNTTPMNALSFIKTHRLLHVSVLIGPSPGSAQLYQNRGLTFSACNGAVVNSSACNIYVAERAVR
jgi:hypothetical protein